MFASSVFDTLEVICHINDDAFDEESVRFNPAHEYALLCDMVEENCLRLDASPTVLQEFDELCDKSFTVYLDLVEPAMVLSTIMWKDSSPTAANAR